MKTWFITGTSRGFGREWAIAALDRGDKVAATARDVAALDELAAKYGDAILPIKLDVTDRAAAFAAVKQAHDHFGRLDVIVNNAKWALEGFSQSLSLEVGRFGVKVTLIEPAGYSTDWSGSSAKRSAPLAAYDEARDEANRARAQRFSSPGNPVATREAILQLVDSDNPPLRLFLGESPLRIAVADYGSRLASWAAWQPVSAAAQGTPEG
jgi:NAD(P)-dependent dehydrogenase (short-subunit alcohol dehydrogenase family)